MTESDEEITRHVLECYDAIYMVLGESAPDFTNDAYVVRTYEMGRAVGALALELRERLAAGVSEAPPALEAVLRHAVASDETGAMTLYAVAMVVGPRLLVTLLDARTALSGNEELVALFSHGSEVLVGELLATGEVARRQPAIEDPVWQAAALDLGETLDQAGNAESLGLSR